LTDDTKPRYGFVNMKLEIGVISLAIASNVGCSDDAARVVMPPPESDGPLYIISTSVYSDDDATGFLAPVPSLEPGATFDLERAVEIPESSISARRPDGTFYTAANAAPEITRWTVGEGNALQKGETLSFVNLGVRRADASSDLFLSDEKAYFHDDDSRQIVVWNPREMEIIGTIPLDLEEEYGLLPWMTLLVRQDRVFAVASWEEDFDADWTRFGDHVRIIGIDPVTDTVVSSTDESRCDYLLWSFKASDGTAYFSPLSYYAPLRSMLGEDRGVDGCSLRVVPPDQSFDQGYRVDLGALAGGRPAGSLFLVDDDTAFIRVWHAELVSPLAEDKSNWEDVLGEPGFLWWRWRIGDESATLIPDQSPAASEATGLFSIDGRKFVPRVNEDYTETTLDELDPAGSLRPALTGPGNIWGIARAR
jgi:hypothetical protein